MEERVQLEKRLDEITSVTYAPVRSSRALSPQGAMRLQELIRHRIKDKKPAVLTLFPESRSVLPEADARCARGGSRARTAMACLAWRAKHNGTIAGQRGLIRVLVDAGSQKSVRSSSVRPRRVRPRNSPSTFGFSTSLRRNSPPPCASTGPRAAPSSSWIRAPEKSLQASYPPFNPNNSGAHTDARAESSAKHVRARINIQDRDRVSGAERRPDDARGAGRYESGLGEAGRP